MSAMASLTLTAHPPQHVEYGLCPTAQGALLAGFFGVSLCRLDFVGQFGGDEILRRWQRQWPHSSFASLPAHELKLKQLGAALEGKVALMPLRLTGTAFQLAVWEALLAIPQGGVKTYGEIAAQIGKPRAVRAVGQAVGANPISVLVPCHRVIASNGKIGGYAWGVAVKQALLASEGVSFSPTSP